MDVPAEQNSAAEVKRSCEDPPAAGTVVPEVRTKFRLRPLRRMLGPR